MQKEAAGDVGAGKYERIGSRRPYLAIEPGPVLEITI